MPLYNCQIDHSCQIEPKSSYDRYLLSQLARNERTTSIKPFSHTIMISFQLYGWPTVPGCIPGLIKELLTKKELEAMNYFTHISAIIIGPYLSEIKGISFSYIIGDQQDT